jgi:nucleoside-diphosphate-sugar epimerase
MTILIAGGTGYLGSSLISKLHANGIYNTKTITRNIRNPAKELSWDEIRLNGLPG